MSAILCSASSASFLRSVPALRPGEPPHCGPSTMSREVSPVLYGGGSTDLSGSLLLLGHSGRARSCQGDTGSRLARAEKEDESSGGSQRIARVRVILHRQQETERRDHSTGIHP